MKRNKSLVLAIGSTAFSWLYRLDALAAAEKFHRLHLPGGQDRWETEVRLYQSTVFHEGQFFALVIDRQSRESVPDLRRITIFVRFLRRMGQPSGNNPHLTINFDIAHSGDLHAYPKIKASDCVNIAKRLKRFGVSSVPRGFSIGSLRDGDFFFENSQPLP